MQVLRWLRRLHLLPHNIVEPIEDIPLRVRNLIIRWFYKLLYRKNMMFQTWFSILNLGLLPFKGQKP